MSKLRYGTPAPELPAAVTAASLDAFYLGAGEPLARGQNLNDLTSPGCYYSASGTISAALTNPPQTNYGFKLIVMEPAPGQAIQLAITNIGACTFYLRRWTGSSWGTWRTIATAQ